MTDEPALVGDPLGRRFGQQLETLLEHIGVDEREIADARERGQLGMLAVEQLVLPDPLLHDIDAVAARTGLDVVLVARIWRALGFADARPGEQIFTDADVAFLGMIARLLDTHLVDDDLVIHITRVLGSSIARMAAAFVDAVESSSVPIVEEDDVDAADRFARIAPDLLPMLAGVSDHAFRRHVRSQARSRITGDETGTDPVRRVVGFADLVGFTALSQDVDVHELAEIIHRFETIAHDTVDAAGGRIVKMIGDEVLFTVEDVDVAADLALGLSEAYAGDERLGDVRVGLACGPVLVREADVFGPVVNLASRLVGLARPGTVLVDEALAEQLGDRSELVLRPMGSRKLKNLGRVPVHVLRRGAGGDGTLDP